MTKEDRDQVWDAILTAMWGLATWWAYRQNRIGFCAWYAFCLSTRLGYLLDGRPKRPQ